MYLLLTKFLWYIKHVNNASESYPTLNLTSTGLSGWCFIWSHFIDQYSTWLLHLFQFLVKLIINMKKNKSHNMWKIMWQLFPRRRNKSKIKSFRTSSIFEQKLKLHRKIHNQSAKNTSKLFNFDNEVHSVSYSLLNFEWSQINFNMVIIFIYSLCDSVPSANKFNLLEKYVSRHIQCWLWYYSSEFYLFYFLLHCISTRIWILKHGFKCTIVQNNRCTMHNDLFTNKCTKQK